MNKLLILYITKSIWDYLKTYKDACKTSFQNKQLLVGAVDFPYFSDNNNHNNNN